MTKLTKIITSLLSIVLDAVLVAFVIFVFAIRTTEFQTFLAQKATDFLSKELGTVVKVDQVAIVFFDRIALKGVYIEDQNKEVLAELNTILINLNAFDLAKNKITIQNIRLTDGNIHLQREKMKGEYNYAFLVDYFSSPKSTTKQEPIALILRKLTLENIDFRYDDQRKSISKFGMDWDHLYFQNIQLIANDIDILSSNISANIISFSALEKCGFKLNSFSSKVLVNDSGIHLRKFDFSTDKSDVHFSKLSMNMHQLSDIYSFVDSVKFNAAILPSKISLLDVSYFATALEGMDQLVELQGQVSDNVNQLKISNFELKTGNKTKLTGSIRLPNFDQISSNTFSERLNYAYIDLADIQGIKLPIDQKNRYLNLGELVNRFQYFETKNLRLDGYYSQFVVSSKEIHTGLGSATIGNGILFTENAKSDGYLFSKSESDTADVGIKLFDLGTLLNDKNFGKLDGTFLLSGEIKGNGTVNFDEIKGKVNRFDYLGYSYQNITILNSSLIDNVLEGKIDIEDDNLNLVYDGKIDFGVNEHMAFSIDLSKAVLENLGFTNQENSLLKSKFSVDLIGLDPQKISGDIVLSGLVYTENEKKFDVPAMQIKVERGEFIDKLDIVSEVVDIEFRGKVDFNEISSVIENQLAAVMPALFKPNELKKKRIANHFTYDIRAKNINEFLSVFLPDLNVASGTRLYGDYDESSAEFKLQLLSDRLSYQNFEASQIVMRQSLINNNLNLNIDAEIFKLNDSVKVQKLNVTTNGSKDLYKTVASWNPQQINESKISWDTKVLSKNEYVFDLNPSYLTLKGKRWDIKTNAIFELQEGVVSIDNFLFERENQYISINGKVSRSDEDKIKLKVSHLKLEDFGAFLQTPLDLKGEVNGFASISNPFLNFAYSGDASVKDLSINGEEVGNVFVQSNWSKGNEKIELSGDLVYRKAETFSFNGDYYIDRDKNNLDFRLVFDNTDISFTNAFLDPKVVGNIRGRLNGQLSVQGSPDKPLLSGKVDLSDANAFIGLLGVNIRTNGKIKVDEYGIYMDNLPMIDEEGNTGSAIGSIYHDNFTNWNFDINVNLEDDLFQRDPIYKWKPKPLSRFLILNTKYNEKEAYYGKGYVTGVANINGYSDNLFVTADVKTEKGTQVFFPMYGTSEIDDEESFVKFLNKDTTLRLNSDKIDFTGVDLDLNFKVTTDAKLKIIFDEKLGDEITAEGNGNIGLKVNNLGDLALNGTYTVKDGVYNFALGPVKQNFYIQEGGYITWTGDPYNANLNLSSYYKVQANMAEISPDQLSNQGTSNQEILCYLDITESLLRPSIEFDIQAPKATESGKALLSRIKSDPDELNRQFFSLLLWKRFQPLQGSNAAGGGTALDLAANQINSMLSQLSNSYQLAVNLDANALTGDNKFEVGV
ncbi:MAG: translocation/assembly module TamB domain-containing protein, partial [Bacteroidetes bacterium]|nr:translocation/assembly module TamB domain-containing protein [Bacteroidota bacterium]